MQPPNEERGLTLIDMADAIVATLDAIEEAETPEQADALHLAFGQTMMVDLPKKVDAVAFFVKRTEADIETLKNLKRAVDAKIAAKETRIAYMRALARSAMDLLGERKLSGKVHTISLRKGCERLEIPDVNALPPHYCTATVTMTPRRDEIKEALKAGEVIPGAALVTGEESVAIR